ncbi:MAG: hypothetical protein U0T81_18340 [Saprospiraceae bacterium]
MVIAEDTVKYGSGKFIHKGVHTVCWAAMDASGNEPLLFKDYGYWDIRMRRMRWRVRIRYRSAWTKLSCYGDTGHGVDGRSMPVL